MAIRVNSREIVCYLSFSKILVQDGYAYEKAQDYISQGKELSYAIVKYTFNRKLDLGEFCEIDDKHMEMCKIESLSNPEIVYNGLSGKDTYNDKPVVHSLEETYKYAEVSSDFDIKPVRTTQQYGVFSGFI